MRVTRGALASSLGVDFSGNASRFVSRPVSIDTFIRGANAIEKFSEGQRHEFISLLTPKAYLQHKSEIRKINTGCLVTTTLIGSELSCDVFTAERPRLLFAKLLEQIRPKEGDAYGIHATAVVDPTAKVHSHARIGPLAVIDREAHIEKGAQIGAKSYVGAQSKIGEDSILKPGVMVLDNVHLGKNCLIHANCTLGSDGYGFEVDENGDAVKLAHFGGVRVGDEVELGAHSTVDQGTVEPTIIGNGVKTDNFVHVGHNARVGNDCALFMSVGIAGSVTVGNRCQILPYSRVLADLPDETLVTMSTTVHSRVNEPKMQLSSGYFPAMERKKWLKLLKKLYADEKRGGE